MSKNEKVKEELELYRDIMENIAAGVFLIRTRDGIIVYTNPAMEQIFGYTSGEMTGKHISTVNAPTDKSSEEVAQEIIQSLRANGVWRGESKNIKKDGAVFWSQAEVSTFEHPYHGEVWVATHQDVTERKRVEDALQESEERFHSLFKNSTIGLYRTSQDGKILLANPALIAMLGYSTFEELTTRNLEDEGYEPGYERSKFRQHIEKAGAIKGIESAWTRKDGSTIFVRESARVIRDNTANILYFEGTVEDITERKRAEGALRESERKFRNIANNIPGLVYQMRVQSDGSTDFSYVSPRATELFGLPADLSSPDWELGARVHPDDRESFFASVTQAIENMTNWNYEGRLVTPTGEVKWFQGISSPVQIDDELVFDGILLDITERKQAEEALRISEERLTRFMDSASDSFYLLDSNLNFVEMNKKALELVGKKKEDVIGKNIVDIVPNVKQSGRYEKHLNVIETGKPFVVEDFVPHPMFGDKHFVLTSFKVGNGLGVTAHDITERKQAEVALRESKEKYRTLIQKIQAAVVVHGPDTQISTCNLMAQELLGLTEDQLLGKTAIDPAWHFFRDDGTVMSVEEYPVNQVIARRKALRDIVVGVHRPNERENNVWVLVNADPVFVNDTEIVQVIVTFIDITARKQAKEGLREANKILQSQLDQINTLHETLREQAIRDSLTGMYNRRYLDETIEREIARTKRDNHPISFMIVDIDLFKEFNDSYGHDFGDEVLIALSALLSSNIRMGNIACRYGGDEFVVVMPGANTEDAERRAETLRQGFSTMPIKHGGMEVTATLSIGISIYPQHGDNGDDIFHCADSALYQAKQAGRNRVQVWKGG